MLLKKKGVDIFTGVRVEEIVVGEEGKLVCRYNEMERGLIIVNENYQTSVLNIYAAGDVIGGIMLAHAATAEAINAIMHIAGEKPLFNMTQVPGCVYTNPEIGSVGISADDAKKDGLNVISKKFEAVIAQLTIVMCFQSLILDMAANVGTQSLVVSSVSGTVIPIFFNSIHIDPAVASGPLITTVNDLVAVIAYYGLLGIVDPFFCTYRIVFYCIYKT